MKIIVLKRDKLGDLLLTTPMLQVLKEYFPSSTIAVIAPESSAWILKDAPFIDELYSYPQPKSFNLKSLIALLKQLILFLKIRGKHFDIAIAAGGEFSHRAVKRLLWMKAKKTIAFIPKNIVIKGLTDPVVCTNQKENKKFLSSTLKTYIQNLGDGCIDNTILFNSRKIFCIITNILRINKLTIRFSHQTTNNRITRV
jgi:ADP-heptose:LPS heptosyltransferase